MASFVDLPDESIDADSPLTSDVLFALRDNLLKATWHPYNKATIGDAGTGLIYDFGVSGTVANVVTADFEDGYQYMIVYNDLSHNSGASPVNLQVELYRETSAAYSTPKQIANTTNNTTLISGHLELPWVRTSRTVQPGLSVSSPGSYTADAAVGFDMVSAQKALRARISFTAGSIDAGKLYLYRRGFFAAG
jgi:hypothetical protein